jgi:hypothetical protein
MKTLLKALTVLSILGIFILSSFENKKFLKPTKNSHITLIGNNLCSSMMNYGFFETEMHLRYPDQNLYIRNMCDGGDTPGFRPHSGKFSPWAFPGAEKFQTDLAQNSNSQGHFETPDEWLTNHKTDILIAAFGFSESYAGKDGLDNFKAELQAFIDHTRTQKYNGKASPKLALVSPIAFQDLSDKFDLPNGKTENANLKLYADAIEEIASKNKVLFVDAFKPSTDWFSEEKQLTTN